MQIMQSFPRALSSVALYMTNFATFIDTGNERAPIAQQSKAKQKRTYLRLVVLWLVVTRDSDIPLTCHAYPGDRPDVTQFTAMIYQLRGQYETIAAAAAVSGTADLTVVFDAFQNSRGALRPPRLSPGCATSVCAVLSTALT